MLGKARASRTRRAVGGVLGASLSIGALALTASGTQAAERMRTRVETVTGVEIAALEPAALVAPITAPIAAMQALAAPATAAPPAPAVRKPRQVTVVRNGETRVYEGAAAEAYLAAHPVAMPPIPPMPPMPAIPAASSMPAVPAVPSVPPVPVVADRKCGTGGSDATSMVVRRSRNGREVTVICSDRIAAAAARAAATADRAARAADVQSRAADRQARAADVQARLADRQARAATFRAEADARRAEWQGRRAEAEGERAVQYAAATQRRAMASALQGLERARASMARNEGLYGEHRAEALKGMDEAIADMRKELREIGQD